MAENKIINMVTTIENILGIYRNFSSFSKRRQVIIVIRVVVEIILAIYLFLNLVYPLYANFEKSANYKLYIRIIYHFIRLSDGIIVILFAIKNSSNYKVFLTEYIRVENFLQKEPTYTKCLKKLRRFFILVSSISITVCIFIFILLLPARNKNFQGVDLMVPYYIWMVIKLMNELRFMLEHMVLYTYITMLQSYLECINQFILKTQMKYDATENRLYKDRRQNNEILRVEEVEHWAKTYECLTICSKHLSTCFKMQVNILK